jgi:L-cysteine S-thiosulfotransferase
LFVRGLSAALASVIASSVLAEPANYRVEGDQVALPLNGAVGDIMRGRRIVLNRETGNCLICHRVPEPNEAFQGDVGPALDDVGARLSAAQLRLRLIDQTTVNPATLMPPYYRVQGLTRVGAKYRNQPVLSAQEIEDVVAYLVTLKP